MKVCIIGDLEYEKEIDYIKGQLEAIHCIVYVPLYEYRKDHNISNLDINFYTFEREYIYNSDYILLISEKKHKTFMFNFGILFGSKKDFKVLSTKNIKNLSLDKLKEHKTDGKTSGE